MDTPTPSLPAPLLPLRWRVLSDPPAYHGCPLAGRPATTSGPPAMAHPAYHSSTPLTAPAPIMATPPLMVPWPITAPRLIMPPVMGLDAQKQEGHWYAQEAGGSLVHMDGAQVSKT
ncbi:hypothetical protein NDA10_001631 [Ustilago hordei]|nr:hypothetical protein NDA10_001631 [Ustilago hordei]